MTHSITDMKARMKHGGYRPNQFEVIVTNPFMPQADTDFPYKCKATDIPNTPMGKVAQMYFGRPIHYAGDRQVEDWTTTVLNDEDFLIRNSLEYWSNQINAMRGNYSQIGTNPEDYKSNGIIRQFGKDRTLLREYIVEGIWPMNVTGGTLDWGTTDTISEFEVTWSMDACYPSEANITGNIGNID